MKLVFALIFSVLSQNALATEDLLQVLDQPEARAELDRITRARETRNKITLLHLGKRSKPVRLKLIEEAEVYAYMSIPFWYADGEGELMLDAFREKRQKSPRFDIRFMTDWASAPTTGDLWATKMHRKLKEVAHGAILRWSRPLWNRQWSGNILRNRMHEKLFVVDGRKLIMGGLNVADPYLQGGLTRHGWHDTDVLLEGPVAQDAAMIFIKNWELAKYLEEDRNPFPLSRKDVTRVLQDYYYGNRTDFEWKDGLFSNATSRIPLENSLHRWTFPQIAASEEHSTPVRLIYDSPMVDRQSKIAQTIEYLIAKARSRVRIFTPYLTITKEFRQLLERTAQRGVKVEIMTNSLESHDLGDFSYLGAVSHYPALLDSGVEIHEWRGHQPLFDIEKTHSCTIPDGEWPGHTLHTKAILIDDAVSLVGSHNLNVRSEDYNSEVMALVLDRAFAAQLNDVFDQGLDADPSVRTVPCGEKSLDRPARSIRTTPEQFRNVLKKKRLKTLIGKHFRHLM